MSDHSRTCRVRGSSRRESRGGTGTGLVTLPGGRGVEPVVMCVGQTLEESAPARTLPNRPMHCGTMRGHGLNQAPLVKRTAFGVIRCGDPQGALAVNTLSPSRVVRPVIGAYMFCYD